MADEHQFIENGLQRAQIDEFFGDELSRAGYGGMDIAKTPMGTQIVLKAEKPGMVIGKGGKNIRKITTELTERFGMEDPQIDVQEVDEPDLNARIGARSRVEKFNRGYIKHNGEPAQTVVDEGQGVAVMKLGTIGVTVKIIPPGATLPDDFEIHDDVDVDDVEQADDGESVESLLAEEPEEVPDVTEDEETDEIEIPDEDPEEVIDEEIVEEVIDEETADADDSDDDADEADADEATADDDEEDLDEDVAEEAADLVAEMEDEDDADKEEDQ
jgi:small subunit ribosomal protein S3